MYIDPIANYIGEQREEARARIEAYFASIRAEQKAPPVQTKAAQPNEPAFEDFDF